ncbi:hypothetical protein ACRAWD_31240 [Caulobacter segnis]
MQRLNFVSSQNHARRRLGAGSLRGRARAFAQTAPAKSDDVVEEVVVTGQRASIQSAQKIKQNAEQLVDLDHLDRHRRPAGPLGDRSPAARGRA